jgi:hypothetical protein
MSHGHAFMGTHPNKHGSPADEQGRAAVWHATQQPAARDASHTARTTTGVLQACLAAACSRPPAHLGHDGLIDVPVALVVHALAQRHVDAVALALAGAHVAHGTSAGEKVAVLVERHLQDEG